MGQFVVSFFRIKYCDQEIVIYREDILNRLLRNCIVPPCGDVVIQKQLVRTIIDGAHLCPLPLTTRQVSWSHDHALRLYPVPDAVSNFLRSVIKHVISLGGKEY